MADNYLENQYEQYQARKAAWEKAKKNGVKKTIIKPTEKPEQSVPKVEEKNSSSNSPK